MFEWVANSQTWDFIVSIFLAMVSGVLIGADRELKGKDAGMRTYSYVVVGATIFTFVSAIIFPSDKTKLAAPIISGLGFLGAGLIMKGNAGHVQNLTTAASVWYSASIGILFGYGYYLYGLLATIFALYISWMPHIKKSRGQIVPYYDTRPQTTAPIQEDQYIEVVDEPIKPTAEPAAKPAKAQKK